MSKDSWIDDNYKVPSAGASYVKFKEGDNKFRILGKPTMGYELWMEGKPVRKRKNNFTPAELAKADINTYTGKKKSPQHFWALPVYDYKENQIAIMNITQQSILNPLLSLLKNPKWGKWDAYDVIINKEKDATPPYRVSQDPHAKLDKVVSAAWKAVTLDMDKYFEGGHPISQVDAKTFTDNEIDDLINE